MPRPTSVARCGWQHAVVDLQHEERAGQHQHVDQRAERHDGPNAPRHWITLGKLDLLVRLD
jgi:hypothetical protein